jgi:hypothetical protein
MAKVICLSLLALSLVAAPAVADEPYPVTLVVGDSIRVCDTKTVICPATVPICDDVKIATMRDQGQGLEIVGVKPGTTLCSAQSANKLRQVFRVTVL